MTKLKVFIFSLLLVLVSCKDDPEFSSTMVKRLVSFTESFSTNGSTLPTSKVNYYYDDLGRLSGYLIFNFDSNLNDFVEHRRYDFTYENEKLILISGYDIGSGELLLTHTYYYLPDGREKKIIENNLQAGLTSLLEINYSLDGGPNTATYSFSNGSGFTYEFTLDHDNIISDKVVKDASLCSEGSYSYDQSINPFSTLGYLDYNFINLSRNNKLHEEVAYLACAFPQLSPEIHIYDYDQEGYPVRVITSYNQSSTISIRNYEYSY